MKLNFLKIRILLELVTTKNIKTYFNLRYVTFPIIKCNFDQTRCNSIVNIYFLLINSLLERKAIEGYGV